MQRIIESCWSTSTRKRHKNLREKGWHMYIAKYLRKISTFLLNFKYYKRILKASIQHCTNTVLNKIIQLLVCSCRPWVGERTWAPWLAVAQDICRPSLLHHTCITWFIMSHKWWKSMAVWGSLVDKVFLSIYMSKCMEHGRWITCSSMTDDTNEYIFPKVLVLKNSDYSNRNFLSTIEIPFGEFAFFHLFLGV